ncbi:MAG: hypothetical protein HLUCCA08_07540 [Rhodobacteraceae bacterium HLUCCA08]|nr:MAG: hypothetical protein HLUCCA08_07540 [Rhodobacteraceae bacterium HLUCCA08]
MMANLALALGLVLVIEGLVWALAPGLVEDLLQALRRLSLDARRALGLAALAFGVALIWAAYVFGAGM